jgi:hypothetical protein
MQKHTGQSTTMTQLSASDAQLADGALIAGRRWFVVDNIMSLLRGWNSERYLDTT